MLLDPQVAIATSLQYEPPRLRRRVGLFAVAGTAGIATAWAAPAEVESAVALVAVGILALITGVLSSWSP